MRSKKMLILCLLGFLMAVGVWQIVSAEHENIPKENALTVDWDNVNTWLQEKSQWSNDLIGIQLGNAIDEIRDSSGNPQVVVFEIGANEKKGKLYFLPSDPASSEIKWESPVGNTGPESEETRNSFIPSHISKFFDQEAGIVRIVFSRIACDISDDCVQSYEAVFEDGRTETLHHNYLEMKKADLDMYGERKIAFRAIFRDGSIGELSDFIKVTETDFRLSGTNEISTAFANPQVMSPVYGSYVLQKYNLTSTDKEWAFTQYASSYHKTYYIQYDITYPDDYNKTMRILSADDSDAWDINIYIKTGGANLDTGLPFYPVALGKVVHLNFLPGTNSTNNGILIQHYAKINGKTYYSAYLHGTNRRVKVGDYVTTYTQLGDIAGVTGFGAHLHLALYEASIQVSTDKRWNYTAKLLRSNADFLKRNLLLYGNSISLKAKESKPASAYAAGLFCFFNLTDIKYYNNTWWTSLNTSIASVDGYGKVTGVKDGSTHISVFFSGERLLIPVTATGGIITIPPQPSGLKAVAVSSTQINLYWNDISSNETGFRIKGTTWSYGLWTQIGLTGPNVTTYYNTGLTPGTTYYYQVEAYNNAGVSLSNIASATTFPTTVSYSSYPSPGTYTTGGNVLKLKVTFNGSNATFTVAKQDNSVFTSSGVMTIRAGAYNGCVANSNTYYWNYYPGYTTTSATFPLYFSSGSKDFYAAIGKPAVYCDGTPPTYYSGKLTVVAQ